MMDINVMIRAIKRWIYMRYEKGYEVVSYGTEDGFEKIVIRFKKVD